MTAREQAEELRQQAIKTLLDERQAIDETLATLGYDKIAAAPQKKRGRPPKKEDQELIATGSESAAAVLNLVET